MTGAPAAVWSIAVDAHGTAAQAFADALEPLVDSVSVFAGDEDRTVMAIVSGLVDWAVLVRAIETTAHQHAIPVPRIVHERLDGIDWLGRNRSHFPKLRYGRFLVHGAHHRPIERCGLLAIEIEAGCAFGSGTHASTEGCLRSLDRLARSVRPRTVIDLGCGSGILAVAAVRLWPRARVLALDCDPAAVETARNNAAINRASSRIVVRRATGFSGAGTTTVDLVTANILAEPLVTLAPDAARRVRSAGHIVLSGLLASQARMVRAAYRRHGFRQVGQVLIGDWCTLVLRRARDRRSRSGLTAGGVGTAGRHVPGCRGGGTLTQPGATALERRCG